MLKTGRAWKRRVPVLLEVQKTFGLSGLTAADSFEVPDKRMLSDNNSSFY